MSNLLLMDMMAVCAAIQSLEAEGVDVIPASSVYLAMGMEWERYESTARALHTMGWAIAGGQTIRLTKRGREIGEKANGLLGELKGEPEEKPEGAEGFELEFDEVIKLKGEAGHVWLVCGCRIDGGDPCEAHKATGKE